MEIENQNLKNELTRMYQEYNRAVFSLERSFSGKLKVENEKLKLEMEIEKLKAENEKLNSIVDNVRNMVNTDSSKKRKVENDHYPPNPFGDNNFAFSFGRRFGSNASVGAAASATSKKETSKKVSM